MTKTIRRAGANATHPTRNRTGLPLLSTLASAALIACGGGGTSSDDTPKTAAITGIVADGPLSNVVVCYDINDNGNCDAVEPSATTDVDGRFSLSVPVTEVGRRQVIAAVPASSIDKDTGAAVGMAMVLKAPPTGIASAHAVFVSPLTTLVVDRAQALGVPVAETADDVQRELGLTHSPLDDFARNADARAALAARVVLRTGVDASRLAAAANLPVGDRQALVGSLVWNELPQLASRMDAAAAASATPEAIAAEVSSSMLAERNLDAGTVAAHAGLAMALKATPAPATTGPFFSIRRFHYEDAGNYSYVAYVGDNTPGSDGTYSSSESRASISGGQPQSFNRNQAYWNRTSGTWEVCANTWQVSVTRPVAGSGRAHETVFCGNSRSRTRVADYDVAGRRMADVVASVRAWPLRDSTGVDTDASGLPTRWGPDPAALGDAVFPAGARFQMREQTSDIGDTERYSLTDKPRVVPASGAGTYRHAATFGDLQRMTGNLVGEATVVTSLNSVFLDDLPATQTNAALSAVKRYRVGFDPASDKVRFYACNVLAATNASEDCTALGDGRIAITAHGDSRTLRFDAGYPAALTDALKRQRLFVERSGAVFGGHRDLQSTRFHQRPNTTAAEALRLALTMPATAVVAAPVTPSTFYSLRSFTFSDVNNYSYRLFSGDTSMIDAQGYQVFDEERETHTAGVLIPYVPNRVYWTGSDWYDCPADGKAVNRVNTKAPFDSAYCKTYLDNRYSSVTVTLDGRNMADVVRDIRWYSSRDGTFSYANWGPNPDTNAPLATATFPTGATLEYRGNLRQATPVTIFTHPTTDRVRVPPSNTSLPFNTWPFASSLDQLTARYAGDFAGGALNGATTFYVHAYALPAAPGALYTTQADIRVAFDPAGNRARFYRAYHLASNGATTAYEALLDTTYAIETLGDARVLKFAAMPDGFERDFQFDRRFAERDGGVWYAAKDSVSTQPTYSIRLNLVAGDALGRVLGID